MNRKGVGTYQWWWSTKEFAFCFSTETEISVHAYLALGGYSLCSIPRKICPVFPWSESDGYNRGQAESISLDWGNVHLQFVVMANILINAHY